MGPWGARWTWDPWESILSFWSRSPYLPLQAWRTPITFGSKDTRHAWHSVVSLVTNLPSGAPGALESRRAHISWGSRGRPKDQPVSPLLPLLPIPTLLPGETWGPVYPFIARLTLIATRPNKTGWSWEPSSAWFSSFPLGSLLPG